MHNSPFSTHVESMLSGEPLSLLRSMRESKVNRGYVFYDHSLGKYVGSGPVMQPVLQWLNQPSNVDADKHEGLFFQASEVTDAIHGAFIWRTERGQGAGGIRLREYSSLDAYLRDGARLAVGMGRKNALAGLWWGGAKGVICSPDKVITALSAQQRHALFEEYGQLLSSLNGCYVAAEDAGVTVQDVDVVFQRTRFTTCISERLGGSGNPSIPTARGLVASMTAALQALYGPLESLAGRTVAVQGVGQVGYPLVQYLLEAGVARVEGAEASLTRFEKVKHLNKDFPGRCNIVHAPPPKQDDILFSAVDIVSPCGYGAVLNERTVPRIKAKIVCGAANNQLVNPRNDYGMKELGITYVPDFVCNRMGIVNCSNEQYGRMKSDDAINRHFGLTWENSLNAITKRIIAEAKDRKITTVQAANELADHYAAMPHPIWGLRSRAIIKELTSNTDWITGKDKGQVSCLA